MSHLPHQVSSLAGLVPCTAVITSPLQQDECTALQGKKPANANSIGK
jgi:hypothetical protein